MRHWTTLEKASKAVTDPGSNEGLFLLENLTEEELTGLTDLEVVHRIFSQSPATLRKELEHLGKSLTKK